MIAPLIIHLLEVHATTGVSSNLLDSSGAGLRVYHQRIPQGAAYPAVVFNILTQTPTYAKAEMALQNYPVSFNVHHELDSEADAIAQNLITILEGWRGDHGGKTWSYTIYERTSEGFDDDQTLPRKIVDFLFIRQN